MKNSKKKRCIEVSYLIFTEFVLRWAQKFFLVSVYLRDKSGLTSLKLCSETARD